MGYLEHNGSNFSGTIDATGDNTKPLYFYFLGNCVDVTGLTAGSTTSCTANISDQTGYPAMPVISFSESNENYDGEGSYTASLHNKASLIKFNVTTPSDSPICITGMNNLVTVNFADRSDNDGFSYDKADANGVIKMKGGSGTNVEKWAIVLQQDAYTTAGAEGTAYTLDGNYKGARPVIPAITMNQYLNEDDRTFEVSTPNPDGPLFTPLTFEARAANVTVSNSNYSILQYSLNGGDWTDLTNADVTLTNVGDKVSFRVREENQGTSFKSKSFSCTGNCYIYGNVMSLLSVAYPTATSISGTQTFYRLFRNNEYIDIHPEKELILPATGEQCYQQMFKGCTGLTKAPALPATAMVKGCYKSMFEDCTGLETVPANLLPATELADQCYNLMFSGCTGLTTAPALPAETLASSCYNAMFYGCTGLTTAPALPATTLVGSCYRNMFDGCTNLETVPSLPATVLAAECCYCMFYEYSSLTTVPVLQAPTLETNCYNAMFYNCINLKNITCLATSGIEDNTLNWVNGVAATGTFTKANGATWTTGVSGIPTGWTVNEQ